MSSYVRFFGGNDGRAYRVALSSSGQLGKTEGVVQSIVFETTDGCWMGSVPLSHQSTLDQLRCEDLEMFLEQAKDRLPTDHR